MHFRTFLTKKFFNIIKTWYRISNPLMRENPVKKEIVPPICSTISSTFAAVSMAILSNHKSPWMLLVAPKSPPVVCWPAIGPWQSAIGVSANHFGRHYMGTSNTQWPLWKERKILIPNTAFNQKRSWCIIWLLTYIVTKCKMACLGLVSIYGRH